MIIFGWDEFKASQNLKKHKVSFKEAKSAFLDEEALVIFDIDHSVAEDRYVLVGMSRSLRLVVVVHSYREYKSGEVIRLISARKANANERGQYIRSKK